ncbi:pyridoxine 5'-phosphate synthase [Wolbachia endosymbiont of Pentidionis agamae]|uniref:pyridoxine 5'-phosphate synthase n=1 Tax=Wolbachia endosymbiont of Pentidionis agamae TaxID=3110435 RepID=UPI002FD6CADE
MKLGVNIDHIATIRNLRNTRYPDILEAASIIINAGADFITVHLREDRRHIRDNDVYELKKHIYPNKLNLEIAATQEMLDIAKEVKPHSICLVPEKRNELTTESGLDIFNMNELSSIIKDMHHSNIEVSLFIDPDMDQLQHIGKLDIKPDIIEIHTGEFCNDPSEKSFYKIKKAAEYVVKQNIECHAGHGISYATARSIVELIPHISALNIGHYLISRAILYGLHKVIKDMKQTLSQN